MKTEKIYSSNGKEICTIGKRNSSNKKYASADQTKKFSFKIDNFFVTFQVLEKTTQTLIAKIEWRQPDNRKTSVKNSLIGDFEAYMFQPIKKKVKCLIQKSKLFISEITVVDIPLKIQHKIGGLCSVEMYLSTKNNFIFSYKKKAEMMEMKEAENFVVDLIILIKEKIKEFEIKNFTLSEAV